LTGFVDGRGNRRPAFCSNGRYVLGASHVGAINEAVSDMFGTSVEFFYQPVGSGPLKADYETGEDITGCGPIRSLSNPASIGIRHDSGTMGYPDHVSKMLNYVLIVTGGTATNPTSVDFAAIGFSNGSFVSFLETGGTDGGGVHLNSTVLSHAFYLAIEGGRNATSGVSVTGVGAANRSQIEKVFFRAETQLMPNNASLPTRGCGRDPGCGRPLRRGQRGHTGGHPGDDRCGPALINGDPIRGILFMRRPNWQILWSAAMLVVVPAGATTASAQSRSQHGVEISANVGALTGASTFDGSNSFNSNGNETATLTVDHGVKTRSRSTPAAR
jgi:hypothetical protein